MRSYIPPIHMPAWPVSPHIKTQWFTIFAPPLATDFRGPFGPCLPARRCRSVGELQYASEHDLRISVDSSLERIVAPERFGLDVDLDGGAANLRNLPEMGGHRAGAGADEADQISFVHRPVGGLARVGADDT